MTSTIYWVAVAICAVLLVSIILVLLAVLKERKVEKQSAAAAKAEKLAEEQKLQQAKADAEAAKADAEAAKADAENAKKLAEAAAEAFKRAKADADAAKQAADAAKQAADAAKADAEKAKQDAVDAKSTADTVKTKAENKEKQNALKEKVLKAMPRLNEILATLRNLFKRYSQATDALAITEASESNVSVERARLEGKRSEIKTALENQKRLADSGLFALPDAEDAEYLANRSQDPAAVKQRKDELRAIMDKLDANGLSRQDLYLLLEGVEEELRNLKGVSDTNASCEQELQAQIESLKTEITALRNEFEGITTVKPERFEDLKKELGI